MQGRYSEIVFKKVPKLMKKYVLKRNAYARYVGVKTIIL